MIIIGVDPGTTSSGLAIISLGEEDWVEFFHLPNALVMTKLTGLAQFRDMVVGYEWLQSYGMAVGESVFRTCHMCGRLKHFADVHGFTVIERTRPQIVKYFTGRSNLKKAAVRSTLLDRFGGNMAKQKGGVLYGISNHMWDALAICVYIYEENYAIKQEQWGETNWNIG